LGKFFAKNLLRVLLDGVKAMKKLIVAFTSQLIEREENLEFL
jgi:hypothetical protein